MSRMKLAIDPEDELELQLEGLAVVGQMLVEFNPLTQPEWVAYLSERVPEHVGRAKRALRNLTEARKPKPPQKPEEKRPPPLSDDEKRDILARLERDL